MQCREFDVFRRRRRLQLVDQLTQGKALPRNHHGPGLYATETIDPFLGGDAPEQVIQVIVARFVDRTIDPHRPRAWPQGVSVLRRVALTGPEFVEVVVLGDVIVGRQLVVGFGSMSRITSPPRRSRLGPNHRRKRRTGADKRPTIEIILFRRYLGRLDVTGPLDQHYELLVVSLCPKNGTKPRSVPTLEKTNRAPASSLFVLRSSLFALRPSTPDSQPVPTALLPRPGGPRSCRTQTAPKNVHPLGHHRNWTPAPVPRQSHW